MKLTKAQDRFINNKFIGTSILKGKSGTGKTTTAIHRAINLENNHCIFEDDKILFVVKNNDSKKKAVAKYNEFNKLNNYYSLFSSDESKVVFKSIEELITDLHITSSKDNYIDIYSNDKSVYSEIIDKTNFFENNKDLINSTKILSKFTFTDFLNEFLWIKASDLSEEEYLSIDRKGQSITIRKNSSSRCKMYELYRDFSKLLCASNYIDIYDLIKTAINKGLTSTAKYSHIIIDDFQELSKIEINYINLLNRNTSYSTLSLVYSLEQYRDNSLAWLIKGRKFESIALINNKKSYLLRNVFNINESTNKKVVAFDSYKYINLKYKNETTFNIDTSLAYKEIFLDDNITFTEGELKPVPVFNEIAAGNPIEINEDFQDNFFLPSAWLERGKDTFILQVKGNSMIDKNIFDGDLVVVKKQSTANHLDIIAASVDGEATLKTLFLSGDEPLLIPANKNYEPIKIKNREINVLGVAIGVIKNN